MRCKKWKRAFGEGETLPHAQYEPAVLRGEGSERNEQEAPGDGEQTERFCPLGW